MTSSRTVEFKLGGTLKILFDEPEAHPGVIITVRQGGFSVTAEGTRMAYTMPISTAVKVKISYVDAKGNEAKIDGSVMWTTADASIITLQIDAEDSKNATVIADGDLGQTQVTAKADADLGEGTREIITLMDVTVEAGEAISGKIEPVGEPEPIKVEPHKLGK